MLNTLQRMPTPPVQRLMYTAPMYGPMYGQSANQPVVVMPQGGVPAAVPVYYPPYPPGRCSSMVICLLCMLLCASKSSHTLANKISVYCAKTGHMPRPRRLKPRPHTSRLRPNWD